MLWSGLMPNAAKNYRLKIGALIAILMILPYYAQADSSWKRKVHQCSLALMVGGCAIATFAPPALTAVANNDNAPWLGEATGHASGGMLVASLVGVLVAGIPPDEVGVSGEIRITDLLEGARVWGFNTRSRLVETKVLDRTAVLSVEVPAGNHTWASVVIRLPDERHAWVSRINVEEGKSYTLTLEEFRRQADAFD